MAGEVVRFGGKRRQNGRGPSERVAIGEDILAGRLNGVQMHLLAAKHKISEPTAYRWLQLALDRRVIPTVDEYRLRENERLDATQRTISENLEYADWLGREGVKAENHAMVQQAIALRSQQVQLQLRLDERRAKLNGLDAPVRVDATITHRDAEDAELEELIREDRARAAREAQEVSGG